MTDPEPILGILGTRQEKSSQIGHKFIIHVSFKRYIYFKWKHYKSYLNITDGEFIYLILWLALLSYYWVLDKYWPQTLDQLDLTTCVLIWSFFFFPFLLFCFFWTCAMLTFFFPPKWSSSDRIMISILSSSLA